MTRSVWPIVALSTIILTTATVGYAATATFQGLGDNPGGSGFSGASAVSDDGLVVVGQGSGEGYRWTRSDGIISLSELHSEGAIAWDVGGTSADGSVIVGAGSSVSGQGIGTEPIRWTIEGGTIGLGNLPGGQFHGFANGTSADGSVVVGFSVSGSGAEAFRWTETGGMIGLGDLLGGGFNSQAHGISANGAVIVGFGKSSGNSEAGSTEAFRWTQATGMVGLGYLPGGNFNSEAMATSANGSVVVGRGWAANGHEPFRWTQETGMVSLGSVGIDLKALATSADGSIIGGGHVNGHSEGAFLWTADDGIRLLRDVLTDDYGINLDDWPALTRVSGISADGLIITGVGRGPGNIARSFVVTIPEPGTLAVLGLGVPVLLRRGERRENILKQG